MIDCTETLTTSVALRIKDVHRMSEPLKYFMHVASSYESLEYIRKPYICYVRTLYL